jgi:hypothetical protein
MVFRGRVYKRNKYQTNTRAIARKHDGKQWWDEKQPDANPTSDREATDDEAEFESPDGDSDSQSAISGSPVNPFLHTKYTGNAGVILQKAKVVLREYMEPLGVQLEHANQTFYQYMGRSDPEGTGWVTLDIAAEILTRAAERWAMQEGVCAFSCVRVSTRQCECVRALALIHTCRCARVYACAF